MSAMRIFRMLPALRANVPQRAYLQRVRTWFDAAYRAEDGVSAIEFALFAPVLFFGLVATADIGLALSERMAIDHVLRAGAEAAMMDQGEEGVLKVLKATATKNFTLSDQADTSDPEALVLSADRYCACSNDITAATECSLTCPGAASTYVYYRLSAKKTYDGMILPEMSFSPSLQVQIQ